MHRAEIMLTATQGILGVVILAKMTFRWFEAAGLFILWCTQIYFQYAASQVLIPFTADPFAHKIIWDVLHIDILEAFTLMYWAWIAVEIILILLADKKIPLIPALKVAWNTRR